MPWSSAMVAIGRMMNSTQTPATRNRNDQANDSERTRAGDTNAWVMTNGGVNMPPMNDVMTLIAMNSDRFGSVQRIAMPTPTTMRDTPAHLIGSPRFRCARRWV